MNAKDKAIELVEKYIQYTPVEFEYEYAKQCALICVDEILKTIQPHLSTAWWQEVKEEINNL